MSTAPIPEAEQPVHPVLRFAGGVREGLDLLIDRVAFMGPEDTAAALRELHAAEAGLAGLRLALIAHADRVGVPSLDACTSIQAWLRTQLLIDPTTAKRQVKLARRLEVHEMTQRALARGEVSVSAVRIVLEAVDGLGKGIEPQLRRLAEAHLLGDAKRFDTWELRRLAARIEEVIDPAGAEQREADALAAAEAKAARETWCHVWFDEVNSSCEGRFKTDLLTGRRFHRFLEALMNPARPDPIGFETPDGARLSADERRGQALVELIGRIPKDTLPRTGGCDPVVVVTMTLETLTGGLKAAVLDTGEHLSPGAARRVAAQHGVIPAVLGTRSEVLDLGRKARLCSSKQRLAMSVQQGGTCAVEGCGVPAAWCQAHHLNPWRNGGRTDIRDCVLICGRHHPMADDPRYQVAMLSPAGRIRINRRT